MTNSSSTTWRSWTGSFTLTPASSVTSSTGATFVVSGNLLTFTPTPANASVAPGVAVHIWAHAVASAPNVHLADFAVHGTAC